MATKKKNIIKKKAEILPLNMTFEEAMKKALNTPLPKKQVKKKGQKINLRSNKKAKRLPFETASLL